MATQLKHGLTPEEYLSIERATEQRSEFISGEMIAMVGGTRRHNRVAGNVYRKLSDQLDERPCEAYIENVRVQAGAAGAYFYPDVAVACGDIQFRDSIEDTLLNPAVVVEVLSPSTADYDRGEKFAHYRRIDSLVDYVLIWQDAMRIEHWSRKADGSWLPMELDDPAAIVELQSIGCRLSMADIYRRVKF